MRRMVLCLAKTEKKKNRIKTLKETLTTFSESVLYSYLGLSEYRRQNGN